MTILCRGAAGEANSAHYGRHAPRGKARPSGRSDADTCLSHYVKMQLSASKNCSPTLGAFVRGMRGVVPHGEFRGIVSSQVPRAALACVLRRRLVRHHRSCACVYFLSSPRSPCLSNRPPTTTTHNKQKPQTRDPTP